MDTPSSVLLRGFNQITCEVTDVIKYVHLGKPEQMLLNRILFLFLKYKVDPNKTVGSVLQIIQYIICGILFVENVFKCHFSMLLQICKAIDITRGDMCFCNLHNRVTQKDNSNFHLCCNTTLNVKNCTLHGFLASHHQIRVNYSNIFLLCHCTEQLNEMKCRK